MTSAYGPKFDRHVVVERIDEQALTFRVTVPSTIENRNVVSAWLAYYDKPYRGFDQPRVALHYDEVVLEQDGTGVTVEFALAKLEPHQYATIRIHLDGMCGAVAEALVPLP